MVSSALATPLLGINVLMHDLSSTWAQYVASSDSLPSVQPNTTVLALLSDQSGTYVPGLYYWQGTRWIYCLTSRQVSQLFTGDFSVDSYHKWFQSTGTQSNSQVYQNTAQLANGTTIPANSSSVYMVLTPRGGGGGRGFQYGNRAIFILSPRLSLWA